MPRTDPLGAAFARALEEIESGGDTHHPAWTSIETCPLGRPRPAAEPLPGREGSRRVLTIGPRRVEDSVGGGRSSLFTPARVFAVSTLFYWAALYIYVPVLPVYARSFGASLTLVGLVVSAYGFGQLVLRIPIGLASDRLGRRKPFCVAGYLIGSLAGLTLLLAPSAGWLVLGRGVAGISAAAWVAITVTFSDYFDSAHAPRAMAHLTVLSGLAQLVSTAAGGWLADTLGWSAPFAGGVGLGLVGTALLVGVPEARKARVATPKWSRIVRVGSDLGLLRLGLVGALLQFAYWATTYTFVPLYASDLGASPTVLGMLTIGALVPYTLAAFGVSRWATPKGAPCLAIIGLVACAPRDGSRAIDP